jgi:hypothetical protein
MAQPCDAPTIAVLRRALDDVFRSTLYSSAVDVGAGDR